jgi:L,D-peptidoglycan transpeptidase YkuD (ErfK/YbiS/YcfS/YnhG family)
MDIEVIAVSGSVHGGELRSGGAVFRCALGRGGIASSKNEGDGATPAGRFPLREVLYRADRGPAPATGLPVRVIEASDGWCDAPQDPNYNRQVSHPYPASAERLWRDDGLYDLIVVIGYNDAPPVPGAGSAIFLHLAARDLGPTEGCVALARPDLIAVLAGCGAGTHINIALTAAD